MAILTVSDAGSRGTRPDTSGDAIAQWVGARGYEATARAIVPDETLRIAGVLCEWADADRADVILTTGGTGLGPRDVTPEATASVCQRMAPGFGEIMRVEGFKLTKKAILSRGTAGICGKTLIVNLPGSPKAVRESLEIILDVLPHAVKMMLGGGH